MKIAIYSPYLDTASGGEKYILTIAEDLAKNHDVDVLLDSHLQELGAERLKSLNSKALGLDLSRINFIKGPFGKGSNLINRAKFLKQYDVLFYNSDGSFFYSQAKKNIVHIQLPLHDFNLSLLDRFKLKSWDLVIYNSRFTQSYVEKILPIPGIVVYPPVNTKKIKPLKKKKQILTVGRFVLNGNPKKQDVLIKSFIEVYKELDDWSFHLAGGLMKGNEEYLEKLQHMAKNYPIYFYPNCSLDDLTKLYGESTIYWHAAGFEEDDPIKMEHFGISTVESMAGGCIPIVINKGGQKEIVDDSKNGFLWNDPIELQEKTIKVAKDMKLQEDLSNKAIDKSQQFSSDRFRKEIEKLI